jgi:hypothetical protein
MAMTVTSKSVPTGNPSKKTIIKPPAPKPIGKSRDIKPVGSTPRYLTR